MKKTTTNSKTVKPKTLATKAKQTIEKAGGKGGAAMAGTAAGAIVGAALGGAAGAALTDSKTRQQMGTKLNEFTKVALETADKLSKNADGISQTVDKVSEVHSKAMKKSN